MIDNLLNTFNDDTAQSEFGGDSQTYKVQAILGYIIPILFFLPYVCNQNSAFCKFHSNQQLALLVILIVVSFVKKILGMIFIIGWILSVALCVAYGAIAILLVIGAVKGMAVKIPFLGDMIKAF